VRFVLVLVIGLVVVLVLVLVLEVWGGFDLRTGVRRFFVPKGLQDSAWGFNPRNTFKNDPPRRGGRVGTGGLFG
jgi:hypothetical protein